jgi:hypothetical protein
MPKMFAERPRTFDVLRPAWRLRISMATLLGACVGGIAVGMLLIQLKPTFAANFADYVMRPIIGDKPTIVVESWFFFLIDHVERVEYQTFSQPSIDFNTAIKTAKADEQAAYKSLNLHPIGALQSTFPPLRGEGQWSLIDLPQFKGRALMARTFVRPDPARSYAVTTLVKLDTKQLVLHFVPGTQEPGGPLGNPGSGIIPPEIQAGNSLVAAFNGTFSYEDGHYGLVKKGVVYVPLRPGVGTLNIHTNGTIAINTYNPAAKPDPTIRLMRQSGPLIVRSGNVTPDINAKGVQAGPTSVNSAYTWRSGIGVTKNGDLLYAVGPSLTAKTLAISLKKAGAVNALQLDINQLPVRFGVFQPNKTGGYSYQSLLNGMVNYEHEYLHGADKGFFYVTAK